MDILEWNARFLQQAGWTKAMRDYLIRQAGADSDSRVLEVGCGTGAILGDLSNSFDWQMYGIDINQSFLPYAFEYLPKANFIHGDGHQLPFISNRFDLTICHFLLLWVKNPQIVINEMTRVTNKGGSVIALAEPDYGGRIDFPNELIEMGRQQVFALYRQGANPEIGRQLGRLFHEAGLQEIQIGVIGGQWNDIPSEVDWQTEWRVLEDDISQSISPAMFNRFKKVDRQAWFNRERILFVPVFYAMGKKY